ncbi:hypothetical protein EVA_06312 [gut metagenome]|uniref:Uncharacterized protein n=1 Tax=gut metagenome TaxID=749906 RepID=J9GSI8_9ZZZZ
MQEVDKKPNSKAEQRYFVNFIIYFFYVKLKTKFKT